MSNAATSTTDRVSDRASNAVSNTVSDAVSKTASADAKTVTPLLDVRDVTVSFDGFKALDGVKFQVFPNTIKVLIGPNGAGKSTLLDTVIGKVRPTSGKIFYQDSDITRVAEYKIAQRGICRKFQAPGLLESLSVHDNLAVAVRKAKGWWANLRTRLRADEEARIEEVLELIQLSHKRGAPAAELAHGEKQWLEIGMVIAEGSDLLLLDEPTAGMTQQETAQTADLIRTLTASHTVLVIDHDMSFVELLGAPVSVLHQGRLLVEGSMEEVRNNPDVVAVYLGRNHDPAESPQDSGAEESSRA